MKKCPMCEKNLVSITDEYPMYKCDCGFETGDRIIQCPDCDRKIIVKGLGSKQQGS
jgi:DNA-directed RNA polymerase subunit RPC12/RpoP